MSLPHKYPTITDDTDFSIGTAAAQIAAANTRRSVFRVQNTHATQILYLGIDLGVGSADHFWALAAGKEINLDGYTGVLWGEGSGAATTGSYVEGLDYAPAY